MLARARPGDAPNPIESIATDAFTAFASDVPEAGLTGLDKLKTSQDVHVLRAREVLVAQAAAWLRPRLARLAKDRNFTASEQILVALQELRPQDAELTAQLASVRERAYLQRSERIHQAFGHGYLALGYVLIAKDAALTDGDRDALKQRYSEEMGQVNQRVLIGGEIVREGALAGEFANDEDSGKGWAVTANPASTARPFFPVLLVVRTRAPKVGEPRTTATRTKSTRIPDGFDREDNPEKADCAVKITDAEGHVSRAEITAAVAEETASDCRRAASQTPYPAIAGAACGVALVSARAARDGLRNKLNNTRSTCAGLAETVSVQRWRDREYEVSDWRVDASAEMELVLTDGLTSKTLDARRILAESSATDSATTGVDDLRDVHDALQLPSRDTLERRVLDDLRRKYQTERATLLGGHLELLDAHVETLTKPVRLEVLARLLLLHGKSGVSAPKKDSWLGEILASTPLQAGDAEALRRLDAAASRIVAPRTVAPGPAVASVPPTSRQPDAADAAVASVIANQSSSPTNCGECSDFCAPNARACLAGDSDACLAAAVCTCRCKLSQGGCGEEVAALRKCEAQGGGKSRKAARSKPAP